MTLGVGALAGLYYYDRYGGGDLGAWGGGAWGGAPVGGQASGLWLGPAAWFMRSRCSQNPQHKICVWHSHPLLCSPASLALPAGGKFDQLRGRSKQVASTAQEKARAAAEQAQEKARAAADKASSRYTGEPAGAIFPGK